MADIFPPSKQRPALVILAERLDSRTSCLRRDECGDWAIFGSAGHIYAVPIAPDGKGGRGLPANPGYQLVVGTTVQCEFTHSARQWSADKVKLKFCKLTQDGDTEGCLILDRLPTIAEGSIIRAILGIPKARHLGEEQRAACSERLRRFREQTPQGVSGGAAPETLPQVPMGRLGSQEAVN
jgi:hypothetical protein